MADANDPKLLNRNGVLACYELLLNDTLTAEYRQSLLLEVFEHIDAQGRLLAKAGNYILHHPSPAAMELKAEIRRAMS